MARVHLAQLSELGISRHIHAYLYDSRKKKILQITYSIIGMRGINMVKLTIYVPCHFLMTSNHKLTFVLKI